MRNIRRDEVARGVCNLTVGSVSCLGYSHLFSTHPAATLIYFVVAIAIPPSSLLKEPIRRQRNIEFTCSYPSYFSLPYLFVDCSSPFPTDIWFYPTTFRYFSAGPSLSSITVEGIGTPVNRYFAMFFSKSKGLTLTLVFALTIALALVTSSEAKAYDAVPIRREHDTLKRLLKKRGPQNLAAVNPVAGAPVTQPADNPPPAPTSAAPNPSTPPVSAPPRSSDPAVSSAAPPPVSSSAPPPAVSVCSHFACYSNTSRTGFICSNRKQHCQFGRCSFYCLTAVSCDISLFIRTSPNNNGRPVDHLGAPASPHNCSCSVENIFCQERLQPEHRHANK
jgi:hypothetical protein